jgi:glycosyltransferase involved in cell wall biosynthesis
LKPGDVKLEQFYSKAKKVSPLKEPENPRLLSVSLIVKNEENSLRGCLESVKGIADEIAIVDTGSDDNTMEIAEEFGAKTGHFEWRNDYAAARNESLKLCTGKWVLYIDADERLSGDSAKIIRELIADANSHIGGYIVKITSEHFLKSGQKSVYDGTYPRLFRNLGYPKSRFDGRVHEQISNSLLEKGYDIINSDLVIEHTGYAVAQEEMQEKVQRNLNYLGKHVEEEPQNGIAWYQLGNSLLQMKMYDKALEALGNGLRCNNLSPFLRANTALSVAKLFSASDRYNDTITWCDYALEQIDNYAPALNMRAGAFMKLMQPEKAARDYQAALDELYDEREYGLIGDFKPDVVRANLEKAKEMAGNI